MDEIRWQLDEPVKPAVNTDRLGLMTGLLGLAATFLVFLLAPMPVSENLLAFFGLAMASSLASTFLGGLYFEHIVEMRAKARPLQLRVGTKRAEWRRTGDWAPLRGPLTYRDGQLRAGELPLAYTAEEEDLTKLVEVAEGLRSGELSIAAARERVGKTARPDPDANGKSELRELVEDLDGLSCQLRPIQEDPSDLVIDWGLDFSLLMGPLLGPITGKMLGLSWAAAALMLPASLCGGSLAGIVLGIPTMLVLAMILATLGGSGDEVAPPVVRVTATTFNFGPEGHELTSIPLHALHLSVTSRALQKYSVLRATNLETGEDYAVGRGSADAIHWLRDEVNAIAAEALAEMSADPEAESDLRRLVGRASERN